MAFTLGRSAPALRLDRRRLLAGGAALAATAMLSPLRPAAAAARPERRLFLHAVHTGETFHGPFWAQGRYLKDALGEIDYLLRDRRSMKTIDTDPRLLDLLDALYLRLESSKPFEVVSGYRSPETNRALQATNKRVAKNSLHMHGMAIDIRLPGRDIRQLRRAAQSLKAGGVGYYGSSSFIHLDVGPVRSW